MFLKYERKLLPHMPDKGRKEPCMHIVMIATPDDTPPRIVSGFFVSKRDGGSKWVVKFGNRNKPTNRKTFML